MLRKFLAAATATLILASPLWAQTYVLLGTTKGFSFEVEAMPKIETAKTRNKILSGDNKDYSWITTWLYDCRTSSIKEMHRDIYNPDGKLIKKEDVVGEWLQTEKGSFGRQALDNFWCKGIL